MDEIITFAAQELVPDRAAVFQHQGIPPGAPVSREIAALYEQACGLLLELARPVALWQAATRAEFAPVYEGEGRNEPRTPVGDIAPRADHLAFYAATLGQRVGDEISARFQANGYALAAMLDSAASIAADQLSGLTAQRFLAALSRAGRLAAEAKVLPYSPGYCGWHISGQRKLFEFLRPQRIGIELTASFLMRPLKSVSGVLIVAAPGIHNFRMSYRYCQQCATRGCRERIRALLAG